jgi:UDP-N-acetylmuramoyl-tripeptide--D-alanyl-D-alanine ligase
MEIKDLYTLFLKSSIISTDTRNIHPGSIFFALKGENFNGNRFAVEALEKGAVAAITDEDLPVRHPGLVRVENTLRTLQQLAEYHRLHSRFTVLAITGSNGKTTTKELCKAVLSEGFRVYATEGNLNNHIGVPLTLLAMDSNIDIGIVEMGANHPGEIAMLCNIAHPDYGLITNIGKAHLEGFGGIEGVAKAKGELFSYLMKNRKVIFLNCGDPRVRKLVPESYADQVYYNGEGGLQAIEIRSEPLLQLGIIHRERKVKLETSLMGSYNTENILAACCVGLHLGIGIDAVARAVQSYRPQNNRSQYVDTGKNILYMDAYNANPSSMRAAMDEFLLSEHPSRLMILGEMRELGNTSAQEHAGIISYLRDRGISQVICVGKSFELPIQDSGFLHFTDADQLIEYLSQNPPRDNFIFIKGSRSNRLEKVLQVL